MLYDRRINSMHTDIHSHAHEYTWNSRTTKNWFFHMDLFRFIAMFCSYHYHCAWLTNLTWIRFRWNVYLSDHRDIWKINTSQIKSNPCDAQIWVTKFIVWQHVVYVSLIYQYSFPPPPPPPKKKKKKISQHEPVKHSVMTIRPVLPQLHTRVALTRQILGVM